MSRTRRTGASRGGRAAAPILVAFNAVVLGVAAPTPPGVVEEARANGRCRNMLSSLSVVMGSPAAATLASIMRRGFVVSRLAPSRTPEAPRRTASPHSPARSEGRPPSSGRAGGTWDAPRRYATRRDLESAHRALARRSPRPCRARSGLMVTRTLIVHSLSTTDAGPCSAQGRPMGRLFSGVAVAGFNHVMRTTRGVGRYARGRDPGVARTADMSTESPAVSGRLRALAWLSIVCALALIVIVVVFAFRHLPELTAVVVGLAVTAAGGWWLITERPPRRWIGLAGALVGLGIIIGAVVIAAADSDQPVLRVRVGRGPGRRDDRIGAPGDGAANPRAGRRRSPRRRSSPPSGAHLQPVVRRRQGRQVRSRRTGQRARRRDGDARPRARSRAARPRCHRPRRRLPRHGGWRRLPGARRVDRRRVRRPVRLRHRRDAKPLRPRPRPRPRRPSQELSTPSVDAVERRIDYATVNDRFFVNNVSLGVYATIVQQEGYRDAKVETTKALLPELLGQHRRALRPPVHRARRHGGRRRVHHPGVEQPLRARILARRHATTPDRHRRARGHRRSRERPGRTWRRSSPPPPSVDDSAAPTGTSSPPSASRCARVRDRPLPASTAKPSTWRRRWCSGSSPAGSVSWCPARTSKRRKDASLATSASTNCSMSHAGGRSGPVV